MSSLIQHRRRKAYSVGGGGGGGISIAQAEGTIPSTATTWDFTSSSFGTAKGCMMFNTNGTTYGSEAAGMLLSIGFEDGTLGRCSAMASLDAQTSVSDANRCQSLGTGVDRIVDWVSTGGFDPYDAAFSSFITDGIRFSTSSETTSVARKAVGTLFGGGDVSIETGQFTAHVTNGSATTVSTSFQPDLIFFTCVGSDAANEANAVISFGACDGSLNQGCVAMSEIDNLSTSQTLNWSSDSYAAGRIDTAIRWAGEVTSIGATSFDVTSRLGGSTSDVVQWMGLKLTNGSAKVVHHTLPTATGNNSITGAGFTPTWCLEAFTRAQAYDTRYRGGTDLAFLSISMFDGTTAQCVNARSDDGVSTTDSAGVTDNQYMNVYNGPGTNIMTVTAAPSFTSDGVQRNFATNSLGNASVGFAVFIDAA